MRDTGVMRAVVLRTHTGADSLSIEEVPDPALGPDECLVDVAATALNRADLLQTMGLYASPRPERFEIPGLEFAGVVSEVGERVTMWTPGDEVMGIDAGGAYAERIAVHERQLMAIPSGMPLHHAAAIPEVFLTAWDALVVQGGLTSGRWALVHAGASGVGTAAIQIAKAIGARIAVTCSAGKKAVCEELGADSVIDYGNDDFVAAVAAATDGAGADVVLDVIGGDYLNRNLQAVARKGRIIQVGLMGGGGEPTNLGLLLTKRVALIGTVLRARPIEEKVALTQRFIAEMLPLFADGTLRPVIDSTFPFEKIADAHRHMAANANAGKIVVQIR
jgi:putative PIG3 family NAD(P)H quinone oxidoreductase